MDYRYSDRAGQIAELYGEMVGQRKDYIMKMGSSTGCLDHPESVTYENQKLVKLIDQINETIHKFREKSAKLNHPILEEGISDLEKLTDLSFLKKVFLKTKEQSDILARIQNHP